MLKIVFAFDFYFFQGKNPLRKFNYKEAAFSFRDYSGSALELYQQEL